MPSTFVAQKAVIDDGHHRILVLLRGKSAPTNPLKWDLPGGDLNFGEDPLTGIARETKEETGLTSLTLTPFDSSSRVNESGEHWTTIAYRAVLSGKQSPDIRISWEHDEYRWVTADEFSELDCPAKIRRYATNYFANYAS